jgi:small subunit ribosomal protein S21
MIWYCFTGNPLKTLCRIAPRRRLFVVKLRLRDNESVNEAVRRFRKLVEHAGVKKEMRKREFYEKPSDMRRRDRRRAEMRARRANQEPTLELT